ncbi:MAG: iron-sulfur cluster carrier protein ApbC [Gammaproteobacteria bacterium]|nr:iron-sulfur cluster carrier protein ApbC [Gammaproteobacteria bacterium]
MFGWWKNKSKSEINEAASDHARVQGLSPEQLLIIQNFQTDELPVALGELLLDIQYNGERLQLQLPFAAQSIVPQLLNQLKETGFNGRIELTAINELPATLGNIKQIILVASGKGGVGKSTTAVNLAVSLAQEGAKTGLLDADIYGPSIPTMLGLYGAKATSPDEKHLLPQHKFGIFMQSIGFLVDPEAASVWRGPMASQALLQLLNETQWPELDYLVVDMPPGTGDIQLTLAQKLPVAGAIVVTTPQDVALADAKKGISMFHQVNIPLLGLVENMSFYQCSSCGQIDDIFGTNGGIELAERYQVPVLGQLPLLKAIREHSDNGRPIALDNNEQCADIYRKIARQVIFALYWRGKKISEQQPEIIMTDD